MHHSERRAHGRLARALRSLGGIGEIVLGMAGVLVRRPSLAGLAAVAGSFALFHAVFAPRRSLPLAVAYFAVATALHYGVLFGVFGRGRRLAQALIARHGEERAFDRLRAVMAFVFCQNGLSTGYLCSIAGGLELVGTPARWAAGLTFFAVGFVVKVWATRVTGLDTYYYRDLFLGRAVGEFKVSGPYRVLRNPMYGVGHLHGYGLALLSGSLAGLAAVAFNQACIWAFHLLVERPHVRRIYLRAAPASADPGADRPPRARSGVRRRARPAPTGA